MDEVHIRSAPHKYAAVQGGLIRTRTKIVRKAADFIVKNGPKTPRERWEEEGGYSPSTIATEIAGLVCAADIASPTAIKKGSADRGCTAGGWQANVEKWTRQRPAGTAMASITCEWHLERETGLRATRSSSNGVPVSSTNATSSTPGFSNSFTRHPADDQKPSQESVKVIDWSSKVGTPNGPGFYTITTTATANGRRPACWNLGTAIHRQRQALGVAER